MEESKRKREKDIVGLTKEGRDREIVTLPRISKQMCRRRGSRIRREREGKNVEQKSHQWHR